MSLLARILLELPGSPWRWLLGLYAVLAAAGAAAYLVVE